MPDTVTFTREWFAMLESLPTVQSRWNVIYAVSRFAFDGVKPEDLDPMEKGIFRNIKSTIMERHRKLNYYTNHKTKASNSPSNSPSNLDGAPLLNIKEVNSNTRKNYTMDNAETLKENIIIKEKSPEKPPKKRKVFTPPTLDEVAAYCRERNNGIDPENFIAFYSSKNWFIGKNKMANWKMAVITWEKARRNQPPTTTCRNQRPVRDYSGI